MNYTTTADTFLFDFLVSLYPQSSKTTVRSWIKQGRVTVDGESVRVATTPVAAGQQVVVKSQMIADIKGLIILYQDKDIVVVDKPAGLLSVATVFDKDKTAHAYLKEHFRPRRVHVVHRLDQETSGVMMFALTERSRDVLKAAFEKHDIERSYIAVVEGQVLESKGTWSSYLFEDEAYVMRTAQDPSEGRLATTHYNILGTAPAYTMLSLKLETGRKNQIRVHCQEAGHPIAGDSKYGAKGAQRQLFLHAHRLSFVHPISGREMHFDSPVPSSFYRLVRR